MIRQLCMALAGVLFLATPVWASPGLCTGPVCADGITRSAKNHWQLVLRLNDQQGHREKVMMNCRAGQLSPMELSLIHISEPTRQAEISYAVFCLKKKKN